MHELAAPLCHFWELVHGPLAHWATVTPNAVALQNETRSLTFVQLHAEVFERSAAIAQHPAVGNLSAAQPYTPSKLTRAQVHNATVKAIHNGFHVEVGNLTTL